MKDPEELAKNLYLKGEYITKHPCLHEKESPWKVSKIVPFIDKLIDYMPPRRETNILDVGGGAGLILNLLSTYIHYTYDIKVNKYALDMSADMLEIQRKRNPDLVKALSEDIRKTSLGNKELDLTLLIDVIEHVPNPTDALEELRRISRFSILKVPLEDNLVFRTWNLLRGGKPRKHNIENFGHINLYNFKKFKDQIEKHAGKLLDYSFMLEPDSRLNGARHLANIPLLNRLRDFLASPVFLISPRLCSAVFGAYAIFLVECY